MFGFSRPPTLVALLLVLGLVAASCGGGDPAAVASPVGADTPAADSGSQTGTDSLIAPTASGGQLDFNDLLGTPTMLWFWAPW